MGLGFIIATIFFITIFWFLSIILAYFIVAVKPPDINPGTFPEIGVTMINTAVQEISRVMIIVFVITTTLVLVLFVIWWILKRLPWPLNYLSKIPPLGELDKTGVFGYVESMLKALGKLPGTGPIKAAVNATSAFIKKFLNAYLKQKNPQAYEALNKNTESSNGIVFNENSELDEDGKDDIKPKQKFIIEYMDEIKEICKNKHTKCTDGLPNFQTAEIEAENRMGEFNCENVLNYIRFKSMYIDVEDKKKWNKDTWTKTWYEKFLEIFDKHEVPIKPDFHKNKEDFEKRYEKICYKKEYDKNLLNSLNIGINCSPYYAVRNDFYPELISLSERRNLSSIRDTLNDNKKKSDYKKYNKAMIYDNDLLRKLVTGEKTDKKLVKYIQTIIRDNNINRVSIDRYKPETCTRVTPKFSIYETYLSKFYNMIKKVNPYLVSPDVEDDDIEPNIIDVNNINSKELSGKLSGELSDKQSGQELGIINNRYGINQYNVGYNLINVNTLV